MNENLSQFMSLQEAALYLKLKPSTLYAWVYQRKIPFRKHGSRVVFFLKELLEWSDERKCDKESPSSLKTNHTENNP
jgi:excisionase family DNA binding protein